MKKIIIIFFALGLFSSIVFAEYEISVYVPLDLRISFPTVKGRGKEYDMIGYSLKDKYILDYR